MTTRALEDTPDAAGAAFVTRGSDRIAAHLGSAAGEMAVCRRGVGVADRSDAAKHELRAASGVGWSAGRDYPSRQPTRGAHTPP